MNIKFLLLTLTSLLSMGGLTGPQTDSVDLIKKAVRIEVMAVIYKTLVGVVLTSTVVFAILQVGRALQNVFVQLEYGLIFQLAIFGVIAVLCLVGLYYLFDTRKDKEMIAAAKKAEAESVDLSKIAMKFAEGFTNGMASSDQKQHPERRENQNEVRLDH